MFYLLFYKYSSYLFTKSPTIQYVWWQLQSRFIPIVNYRVKMTFIVDGGDSTFIFARISA